MPLADDTSPDVLGREYAAALAEFLAGAGEAALARGYAVGRVAARSGLGILDLALLHHQALARAVGDRRLDAAASWTAAAGQFLAEALSPFEMTLRSYQANARLLGLGESLAQQNAEIDRAREQLRTILDATTAVIYLKDDEGRYLFVNRQFLQVFGVSREDVLGKTGDAVLPAAVAEGLAHDDPGVIRARTPREVEVLVPLGDGPHTYLCLKFPLVDASGVAHGVCCVATDITEQKRALAAAEREHQLTLAVAARDQFLVIASHELRTPLAVLELQVGSLRRIGRSHPETGLADERVRSKLDTIGSQVERFASLVETLIDVGRITSGALALARDPVDLAEVVCEVVRQSEGAIRRCGSVITLEATGPIVGRWDPRRIETVVANLVSNAIKFGAGRPIEIAVRTAGDRALLSIRDHGIGISARDRERIFERFERAVSERHFGGFGLGLWVARQTVEAHGGAIRVRSHEGAGAEFSIELPLAPRAA